MDTTVRLARLDELEQMRAIEWAAGRMFLDVGLDDIARHEPESLEGLAEYIDAGRAFVVVESERPVGYALVDMVDNLAHLEQLSVYPDRGRRGLGSALLEHVCDWARRRTLEAVTLTTFRDVPWNAPFYATRGFVEIEVSSLGPELAALRAKEAAHGLELDLRVCMRRDL